jgi:hypothetical protein
MLAAGVLQMIRGARPPAAWVRASIVRRFAADRMIRDTEAVLLRVAGRA